MVNNMEKEYILILKVNLKKEYGQKVNDLDLIRFQT